MSNKTKKRKIKYKEDNLINKIQNKVVIQVTEEDLLEFDQMRNCISKTSNLTIIWLSKKIKAKKLKKIKIKVKL